MPLPEEQTLYSPAAISLALTEPLRFTAPMIGNATRPVGFTFWAHLIQYAFNVDDPQAIPPLVDPLIADEESVVRGFMETAEDLSRMQLINYPIALTVQDDGSGNQYPTLDSGPLDSKRGFLLTFRHLYGTDKTSFARTNGILMAKADAATDADAQARIEHLKKWAKAVNVSTARLVDRSVLESAVERGAHVANRKEMEFFIERDIPSSLLSTYFSGEDMHRGDTSHIVEARAQDPLNDDVYRFQYLKAALGLSHLYFGYAECARTVASL